MPAHTIPEIKERLRRLPRTDLIRRPTPLAKLDGLTKELGGPEFFIKREDLTGLAFGGNKSRKLEYILPDVQAKKADVIITWAGIQSNWCLQTAAAARRFGITPLLLLFKTNDLPEEFDGNLLLDLILGADIRLKEAGGVKFIDEKAVTEALDEAVQEVKERGFTPYVAPVGGSMTGWSMDLPLGAIGYVDAFVELLEQGESAGIAWDYVVHATGSGGTQAGLVAAARALSDKTRVLGISVLEGKKTFTQDVLTIAEETVAELDLQLKLSHDDIIVFDEYIREGYGILDRDVARAIRKIAVQEGIFLDPVYTGKAMSALIDLARKGYFQPRDKVLFLHTGGTPALFPNKHILKKLLSA